MPPTDLRNPAQFNAEYRRLAPLALAAANRVLRDEAAAEDVVQDVFMQLWLRPASFDPARGSLTSYVTMMARSRAVDRWRTRSARDAAVERSAREAAVATPVAEDAAERVIALEGRRRVMGAIDRLPGEQREAVLLAFG